MKVIGSREKGYTLVSSFDKEKEQPPTPETKDKDNEAEGEIPKAKISKNNK